MSSNILIAIKNYIQNLFISILQIKVFILRNQNMFSFFIPAENSSFHHSFTLSHLQTLPYHNKKLILRFSLIKYGKISWQKILRFTVFQSSVVSLI